MDIFRDYFTRENLLASIAKAPYIPGRLGTVFESRALTSTVLALEEQPTNGATILAGVLAERPPGLKPSNGATSTPSPPPITGRTAVCTPMKSSMRGRWEPMPPWKSFRCVGMS